MEAREFTGAVRDFEKLGAVVLGVSPDTPECHAAFREKHGLAVGLLADPRKKTLAAYGAWGMKNMYGRQVEGVIRSTVIVDPDGNVAHHWKTVRAEGHAAQVKARLEELRKA